MPSSKTSKPHRAARHSSNDYWKGRSRSLSNNNTPSTTFSTIRWIVKTMLRLSRRYTASSQKKWSSSSMRIILSSNQNRLRIGPANCHISEWGATEIKIWLYLPTSRSHQLKIKNTVYHFVINKEKQEYLGTIESQSGHGSRGVSLLIFDDA